MQRRRLIKNLKRQLVAEHAKPDPGAAIYKRSCYTKEATTRYSLDHAIAYFENSIMAAKFRIVDILLR